MTAPWVWRTQAPSVEPPGRQERWEPVNRLAFTSVSDTLGEFTMRRLYSLIGVSLMVAACTGTGAGGSGSATASPGASATPASTYSVETGSDKLLMELTEGGGNVPLSYQLTHMPAFALYGDGRIIVRGPQIEIYPAPLLPNLRVIRITPDEIQKILAAADAAGLLGPDASFDATDVFDLGVSVFTTTVAGKTHKIRAYALYGQFHAHDPAIDAERAKLMTYRDAITDLSKFLGRQVSDEEAYEPTSIRVFAGPADESDTSITRQVVDWPLALDPATAGEEVAHSTFRCLALSGADLTAFVTVAKTANTLTVWKTSSGRYSVLVRPNYPDESGCS